MKALLAQLKAELAENSRLRLGLALIAGIAWLYALLVAHDGLTPAREKLLQQRERVERLNPFQDDKLWTSRAEAARRMRLAFDTMAWEADSRTLAEAGFRDWLDQSAQRQKLKVKDLAVRSPEGATARTDGAATDAGALPGGYELVRARMVFDFSRDELMGLLLALHQNPKQVVVDRLVIRNPSPAAGQVEMDVHAVFAIRKGAP